MASKRPRKKPAKRGRIVEKQRGPGLVKTRAQRLIPRRQLELWRTSDYRWRELFERADVMSEGATKSEGNHLVYYGTTSVLLALVSSGGQIPDAEAPDLARMLEVDPHARLRAIRVACREAQVRSGGVIGRVRAELAVRTDPDGIRVDIEVEAPVHRESTSARPATPPKR